jgi:regulator of replication initiation timing
MGSNRELRERSHILFIGQVLAAALFMILFLCPASTAEANVIDKIKGLYDLPGDVDQLKKQYEDTKQQLEDQKAKLEEQIHRNSQLQDENKTLQTRLQDMEQSVIQAKNKRVQQFKIAAITIASLIILYFMLGRLFRYLIWQRNKKQEH